MQEYSDPSRASDPHALPDLEIFELTAREVAEMSEELLSYQKGDEFRAAHMNDSAWNKMLDQMVEDFGITDGWFYWYVQPGCLPTSEAIGPFSSYKEALADARMADDMNPEAHAEGNSTR